MKHNTNNGSLKAPVVRLLVVDDDKEYARTLENILCDSFQVSISTYEEAISDLKKRPKPDVVLANYSSGTPSIRSSGHIAFFLYIQKNMPDVKTVILTAERDDAVLMDSGKDQLDAYMPLNLDVIVKPETEFELKRILFQTLRVCPEKGLSQPLRFIFAILAPALVFVAFVFIWELASRWFGIKEYLLPAPSRIASVLTSAGPVLLKDAAVTMAEALLGFSLANILSIFVAVGFSHSSWLERSFYPYVIALKSVPVIALSPLLVIWFGYGFTGKVVMAGIISFFPLVVNATIGLKNVDTDALDLMFSLSASKWQILWKLRFPTAVPYILSALKISSALSVMGAIIAEMTGASAGLGYTIMVASYNIDTPMMFAAVVVASLCGIGFFGLIALIEVFAVKTCMLVPRKDST